MSKQTGNNWHGCPIRFGMGVFGDKWTLLIVRDLMFKGKKHYGEFTDPEENISTNILADRLNKLVENGIVTKSRDSENRSRYVYGLSEKGMDLLPMMLEMIRWSEKYDVDTEVPPEFSRRLRRDTEGLMKEIRKGLVVN
jgi:DNA-binding HxlR family transcriptional regulator